MKKSVMMMPAVALALLLAAPASATFGGWYFPFFSDDDLEIKSYNTAEVKNVTKAESDTGDNNTSYNKGSNSGDITTGDAWAEADSSLFVNSNTTTVGAPCNCFDDVTLKSKNYAYVTNITKAEAETGENTAMNNGSGWFWFGGGSDSGDITTGNAFAGASSWTAVNSNVTTLNP